MFIHAFGIPYPSVISRLSLSRHTTWGCGFASQDLRHLKIGNMSHNQFNQMEVFKAIIKSVMLTKLISITQKYAEKISFKLCWQQSSTDQTGLTWEGKIVKVYSAGTCRTTMPANIHLSTLIRRHFWSTDFQCVLAVLCQHFNRFSNLTIYDSWIVLQMQIL